MTRRSSNRLARNEERTNLHRSNNLHNVQKGKLLYVHSIVNLMTLIVYVETEECELESFDDDDEDDETADDDEDDCYDDDRANKSIHSNPETDNLTASSLNKQSKTDLSSSAVASDDEHTIISSNGSKDVDDDNDVHNHNNNDGDDDDNDNNDNSNGFQPTVSSILSHRLRHHLINIIVMVSSPQCHQFLSHRLRHHLINTGREKLMMMMMMMMIPNMMLKVQ